jgi:hypothetical protein
MFDKVSVIPVPLNVSDSDPAITPSNVVPLVNVTFNTLAVDPEVTVPLPDKFVMVTVPGLLKVSRTPLTFTPLLKLIEPDPVNASVLPAGIEVVPV